MERTLPTYKQIFNNSTTLVPIQLCQYVIENKLIKPFQLYMQLKGMKGGRFSFVKEKEHISLQEVAYKLGRSERTVRNNLKKLLQLGWIGFDSKTKVYHVRGYYRLKKMLGIRWKSCAEFSYNQIKTIHAFCTGAVIGFNISCRLRQQKKLRQRKKSRCEPLSTSVRIIKEYLQVPLSTAIRLRNKAEKHGYLMIKARFDYTGIPQWEKKPLIRTYPDYVPFIRTYRGMIYLKVADEIYPQTRFKLSKKS